MNVCLLKNISPQRLIDSGDPSALGAMADAESDKTDYSSINLSQGVGAVGLRHGHISYPLLYLPAALRDRAFIVDYQYGANHDIEVGLFYLVSDNDIYDRFYVTGENDRQGKVLPEALKRCKNSFVIMDFWNSSSPTTYQFLRYHKEDIRAVICYTPTHAEWLSGVTGCNCVYLPPPVLRDSCRPHTYPPKDCLVYGTVFCRGGLGAQNFARKHFGTFDTIVRNEPKSDEALRVIDHFGERGLTLSLGGAIYPQITDKLGSPPWRNFIEQYKYVIDGTTGHFFYGAIGLDALYLGGAYIGYKGLSYTSLLFEEIAIPCSLDYMGYHARMLLPLETTERHSHIWDVGFSNFNEVRNNAINRIPPLSQHERTLEAILV